MPLKLAQPTDELTPEEFLSGLDLGEGPAQQKELTDEEFLSGLEFPERAGLLREFGGGLLEQAATIPELGAIATRKLTGQEAPFFEEWAGGLRGLGQIVQPQETRGLGGLSEQVASTLGGVAASAPALALGPGAAGLQFGAMEAVPLYHEIKAKTGDEEAATWGLLGGMAIGQLEKFGVEQALGGIVSKLAKSKVVPALERSLMSRALGAAGVPAAETVTEASQQALSDALYETLTGEDIDNLQRVLDVMPVSVLVGSPSGLVKEALDVPTRPRERIAPKVTPEVIPEVAPPTEEPGAPETKPAPGVAQKAVPAQPAAEAQAEPTAQPPVQEPEVSEPEARPAVVRPEAGQELELAQAPVSGQAESETKDAWRTVRSELEGKGWRFISSDEEGALKYGGVTFPTVERGPVKMSFSRRTMVETNGQIFEFDVPLPKGHVMLDAITVDPTVRKKGEASKAFSELLDIADKSGITYIMEPAPIMSLKGRKLNKQQLISWYKRHGFEQKKPGSDALLIRTPKSHRPELKLANAPVSGQAAIQAKGLKSEQAPEQVRVPEQRASEPELLFGGIPGSAKRVFESAEKTKERLMASFREYAISEGNKPEEARRLMELHEGEMEVVARSNRIARRRMERAMRQAWGDEAIKDPARLQGVRTALQDPAALAKLPEPVRLETAKMRNQIDANSRRMVQEGVVKGEMAKTFQRGEGEYLHGTYQAHKDPEWADKVPKEVRNRLHSLLVSYSQPLSKAERTILLRRARASKGKTMDARRARTELSMRRAFKGMSEEQISNEMQGILQEAKETAENPWVHLAKGKLGRKDMSIFKRRKGLPEELKAFLGEETNPITNYVDTMWRQSLTLSKHRMFTKMRRLGLDHGWLSKKRTDRNTSQLADETNRAIGPLNGLYTTPEIKKALLEQSPEVTSMVDKLARVVAGTWKRGKTIYNIPTGPLKQIEQNFSVLLATGNPFRYPKAIIKAWRAGKLQEDAYIDELIQRRIIQPGIMQEELNEMYRAFRHEPKGAKGFDDFLGRVYGLGDNAARVAVWESEVEAYKKAGFSEEQAKASADEIALNIVPTPSRIAKLGKKARPYMGFISYALERLRTTGNLIRLSVAEMRSGNSVLARRGTGRLARIVAAGYALQAIPTWINMLNGVDDEEDADRDRIGPYWSRGHNKIHLGTPEEPRFFDISQFDHLAWFAEPVSALLSDKPEEALDRLKDELLDPITSVPFVEVISGKTAVDWIMEWSGLKEERPVFTTPRERIGREIVTGIPFLWIGPIAASKKNLDRWMDQPQDAANSILGVRSYASKPMEELSKNARRAQAALSGVSEKVGKQLEAGDMDGAVAFAGMERGDIFRELSEDVRSATRLGFNEYEIQRALREGGLSEDNANAAIAGFAPSAEEFVYQKERRRQKELTR